MADVALAAARAIAGRLIAGQPGQQSERLLVATRLDGGDGFKLSASVASSLNNRIAARASVKASFALVGFLCSAPSITAHGLVVGLEDDCAAWTRFGRVGEQRVKPECGSTVRRSGC